MDTYRRLYSTGAGGATPSLRRRAPTGNYVSSIVNS
eukprot:XP_001709492.1 Hypothetical protein GL50803_38821 [Giardia lamblia ATCC 50803]